jgi:DHA1 family bicyclomycin/chloramphenicol resistance-like MFS transporter
VAVLRPNTLALTAVLALLTSLGPLSTDMYLPSLPQIVAALGATVPEGQLTLSIFLAGFAVGMLVYGPVGDRLGRKPVLTFGLVLFTIGSVGCALAPSIEVLIAARFVQALGGCGPVILARSIVRDLYHGTRAGQELARMGAFMGFIPAVAPTLGGFLQATFGWRSSFIAITGFAVLATLLVTRRLPETLKEPSPAGLSPATILRSFAAVGRDGGFRAHVAIICATYAGLFSFISGSSFVLQDHYGLGPVGFGLAFGACAAAFVAGTLIGQRAVVRIGFDGTLGVGAVLEAVAGLAMLAAVLLGPGNAAEVVVPMMLYMIGLGLSLPQATAGAIIPFPDRAGAASSLMGFLQMVAGSVTGIALGQALAAGAWPLAAFIAVLGVAVLAIWATTRGVRRAALG